MSTVSTGYLFLALVGRGLSYRTRKEPVRSLPFPAHHRRAESTSKTRILEKFFPVAFARGDRAGRKTRPCHRGVGRDWHGMRPRFRAGGSGGGRALPSRPGAG